MRIRVKVKWIDDSWSVDLPSWAIVPGSWLPVIPGVTTPNGVLAGTDPALPALAALSCLVDVPDADIDPITRRPSREVLSQRYKGQSKWDDPNRSPDI